MAGAAPSAKAAPFLRPLDTFDRGLALGESALCVVIVLAMVLAAVAEAAAGVLHIQHPLVASASDVLMNGTIWAAFLGASFATRGRRHLAIDSLNRLLPARPRHIVAAVASTLGAVVALSLSYGIYESLIEQVAQLQDQIANNLASGIADAKVDRSFEFQFVIPGGFLIIGLRLALHGFHEFMAAASGAADAAPVAPTDDHAEKHAPIAEATLVEAAIAGVALMALFVLTMGTTVMGPMGLAVVIAFAMLGGPLFLRWRRTGGFAPTATAERNVVEKINGADIAAGIAGIALVSGLAWYGIQHIERIPIGWGVAFFATMAFLGAPLFTFLGGLALFLWLHGTDTVPAMSLPNSVEDVLGPHFARMSVLPTIPIFTLAGYLLSESRAPERLVRVARAFLGFMPGGLAVVCVFASAFFTVFSGASGITIVAVGGLLLPALLKDKYPEGFSLGLVTTGGALGITLPLCLPVIVYGIVAGLQEVPPGVEHLSLQKFMFAGLLPGLFLIGLLCVYSMIIGVASKVPRSTFDAREAMAALWEAKWELMLPVVPVVGLLTGIFSPVGAAAFTAFYVLFIEVFLYKDLSLTKDVPRVVPESMILVGAIFVKLCAATVLTFYFVQAQTADRLFESLTCGPAAEQYMAQHSDAIANCREAVNALAAQGKSAGGIIDSPITFLIALNVFLLVVGMLMDIFSAIVVIVPLIMGIALHFNINPYHLGVVFLLNLEIGYLMPPMGLNLFIAGFRFNRPVPSLYKVVLPFIGLFVVALMVTTYVPSLSLALVPKDKDHPAAVDQPMAPAVPENGAAAPPANPADCESQRENESFEDFDKRCNITGAYPPAAAPAAAPATDCNEPRPNEAFEDFDKRCHITGP